MKPITNILLIIYIIVYTFLPIFDVSLIGGQTGFDYTSHTITNSDQLLKQIFSLVPFITTFAAISLNCMKNRFWGIAVAVLICIGIYFYVDARNLVLIQQPEFFKIQSLGVGFYIGYATLLLSLVSAACRYCRSSSTSSMPVKYASTTRRPMRHPMKHKKNEQPIRHHQ